MKTRAASLLLFAVLAPHAVAQRAPEVRASNLAAEVRVTDGVATTRLALTIANGGRRDAEATWLLPLPEGSVADDFRMIVNGVETTGEVLGAERARSVYEGIVRARRDPGLLEYVGRGCLRARLFPIPAHGEIEVRVTYREILPEVGGVRRWSFPLGAAGLGGRAPESAELDLSIESRRALRNVFSPTRGLQVVKTSDHAARASFEGRGAGELEVFYGLSDREFGLDLLTTRAADETEGTFLMLISPKRSVDATRIANRAITFVLDTSGSMAGEKITQARAALRYFLHSLRAGDHFNVVTFATEAQPFFPGLLPANADNIAAALERAGTLRATGGTNIDGALAASLRADVPSDLVPIVVFLTDGLPTVQEKHPDVILDHARTWNTAASRLFVFGVGNDVNTRLLDTLAQQGGGTRSYVRPGQDIEVETSALFAKLSRPVLTNLKLAVEGVELSRIVPRKLPDLFHGGRITVLGRYRGDGPRAIRLSGHVAGEEQEFVYEGSFARKAQDSYDFVPSLWAERRVALLLDEMRLHGKSPELEDEVRRLGRKHQIVTPYTSHLIVEEGLAVRRPRSGGHSPGGTYVGPGDSVPGGGGGGGPATPGPGSPGAPGSRAPMTGGSRTAGAVQADLDRIARKLRDAGVLPKGASDAELRTLARDIAAELLAADRALRGLGEKESGKKAVDDSAYLRRLTTGSVLTGSDDFFLGRAKPSGSREALLARFVRPVKGKIFYLRLGIWTDRELIGREIERVSVEAFSPDYFELLAREPRLLPYFAFSSRIAVLLNGVAYEVRMAAKDTESK
ncbi:MAG: VWA domain-containing protein [bacterium]|nr:VWA domain-containing protein [bacterium]